MGTPSDQPHDATRTRRPRLGSNPRVRARGARRTPPLAPTEPRTPEGDPGAPRIIAEHSVIGPYGEEEREVVDDRGRHFWSLRPQPAGRYDTYGFGWFWWLVLWLVIIGLIVWGWGWGWAY
jgi:hypothetical protein